MPTLGARITALPLLILSFVAGCASTANYDKMLTGWVGSPAVQLIEKWGVPRGTYRAQDGTEVVEYVRDRSVIFNGNTISAICKTRFTIGPDGIVKQWSHSGNDCTA